MSTDVAQLHRTLEQELVALLRGASLECLGCGEFVLHERERIRCPECGLVLEREVGAAGSRLDCESQAG